MEQTTPLIRQPLSMANINNKELPSLPVEDGANMKLEYASDRTNEDFNQWKPKLLSAPVLLTVVGFSIACVIVLQLISSYDLRNDGVFFTPAQRNFPTAQSILCFYVPIALAVCYSIIFAWIDLDAKRLEPFYQLSKTKGSTADNSLLLQYQFEFLATVPFKAFKLRHWSPFCAGIGMIAVFWAIAPLSGAIFKQDVRHRSERIQMVTSGSFLHLPDQEKRLNTNFWNEVYAIRWLRASLPKFTNEEVALLPFSPAFDIPGDLSKTTLTAETTAFGTDLDCTPATVTRLKPLPDDVTVITVFDNGQGCSWAVWPEGAAPPSANEPSVVHYGWYPDGESPQDSAVGDYMHLYLNYSGGAVVSAHGSSTLPQYSCPEQFSNLFLVQWSVPFANAVRFPETLEEFERYDQTSMFCAATYFQQQVRATVDAFDQTLLKVEPLNSKEPFEDAVFNTTRFIARLGNDVQSLTTWGERSVSVNSDNGIASGTLLGITPRLKDLGVVTGRDVARYIFGTDTKSLNVFQDPQSLADAFRRTHRLLFNSAISKVIVDDERQDRRNGTYTSSYDVISTDRPLIIALQSFLGFVAALAMCLLVLSFRRKSSLRKDPASIFDIVECLGKLRAVSSTQDAMRTQGYRSQHRWSTKSCRWQLCIHSWSESSSDLDLDSLANDMKENKRSNLSNLESRGHSMSEMLKVPFELRTFTGCLWVLLHILAISTVAILKHIMNHKTGLPLPSSNEFTQNVVLSYLPIAFSTFLEPFWVLLSRTRCMLEPFAALGRGEVRSAGSLKARYLSLPPQLVLWRALRSRHFVLALLCSVSVIANVLAICFSQLFEVKAVTIDQLVRHNATYQPQFSGSTLTSHAQYDYVYTWQQSLSDPGALPPWVQDAFFFVPDMKSSVRGPGDVHRQIQTPGIGVDVTCSQASITKMDECDSYSRYNMSASFQFPNGSVHEFHFVKKLWETSQDSALGDAETESDYTSAGEYSFSVPACPGCFFASWLRRSVPDVEDYGRKHCPLHWDSTALGCVLSMKTAMFNVSLDDDDRVQHAIAIQELQPVASTTQEKVIDLSVYLDDGLDQFLPHLDWEYGGMVYRQSGTAAYDWLTYFMQQTSNASASFLEPNTPAPIVDDMMPLVAETMKRFFALYLGMNTQWLEPATSSTPPITGTIRKEERRVFFQPYIFQITIALLSLDLVVALLAYVRRPRFFLSRLPTTPAAVLSYFAYTQALRKIVEESDRPEEEKTVDRDVYAYGKFVGTDGKPHVGIEMQPFVVPLGRSEAWKRHRFWKSRMNV